MEREIKVSVIIPIYNVEPYLHECVDSVLAQTYKNIEVLLVDDGSPDGCPTLCDDYAKKDARVRAIHKENGGLSSARECGLWNANGEYILVVDGDDSIDADTVEECLGFAERHGADCVMFGYVREYPTNSFETHLFDGDLVCDCEESEKLIHRRIVGPVGEELREPHKVDSFSAMCMKLYKTEAARRGRIVSERRVGTSEDTVFNLYALDGCRIAYLDRCFYHYRKTHAASITARYKSDLAEKWDVLYDVISDYISSHARREEYTEPFYNRVACGMIGLGLNETADGASCGTVSHRLRRILERPLYREAFSRIDTSYCGARWKLFFFLCRHRAAYPLAVLLKIMDKMRKHSAS